MPMLQFGSKQLLKIKAERAMPSFLRLRGSSPPQCTLQTSKKVGNYLPFLLDISTYSDS